MVVGDEFAVVGEGGSTVYNAELPPLAALRDGLVLSPNATPNLLIALATRSRRHRAAEDAGRRRRSRSSPTSAATGSTSSRAPASVATVDKASSAKPLVAYHAVALGGGHFDAAWAGSGRIALWGEGGLGTIDVRTWKTHAIAPGVSGALATPYGIAAWTKTPDGLAVYTPNGARRFRLLQGKQVTAATAVGPFLYADTAFRARYAIDLRTGKATGPLPTSARIVTPSYVVIP